jgi:hypothetical protein
VAGNVETLAAAMTSQILLSNERLAEQPQAPRTIQEAVLSIIATTDVAGHELEPLRVVRVAVNHADPSELLAEYTPSTPARACFRPNVY